VISVLVSLHNVAKQRWLDPSGLSLLDITESQDLRSDRVVGVGKCGRYVVVVTVIDGREPTYVIESGRQRSRIDGAYGISV